MPKVSVIVPCFNMEKYIERCLDSLQKQLLEDIEIICIDDKSTDNTLEILKERAKSDARIRVIAQENNMGVAVARNAGIDAANGEYIGFVDADDYIDIDFYQKLYNHSVKTGAEITKGLLTNIENGKRWIPPTNDHVKRGKIRFCYDFTSAIYKRDFINKHNLRFMQGVLLGEDITFLIKASYLSNDVAICPFATSYYYLIHKGSAASEINRKKVESILTITDHVLDFANNAVEMSKTDYDFIIWFIMDQLIKNLKKAKFEDKHLLEQKVFDIIQGAKIPKDAEMVMCNVFAQQSAELYDKYIPSKQILKLMKRRHVAVYDVFANRIIFEFKKLFGLITITETQAFTKIKLFGILGIYKKYKGHKPIQVKNYPVNLVDGMPKISIIVPFYHVEKYVGACMESLINQTMKDIEIICIDDCGTDNSRQIVEQFAQNDKRIKIVTNDKNRGLSYSRNVGIKHATAPYITFCDSDDLLTHDACEKLFNAVHNKSDIAVCSMDILYEADKEKQKQDEYLKLQNDGVFDMNKSVQVSCNVCTPAKLYKRQIIVENKIEFPVGLRHEDEFFYPAYCIWAKSITWISEGLYIYRRRQESIMNSVHKSKNLNLDPVKITIKYLEYCKKLGVWQREKHWFWDVMFPGMFNASLLHSGPIHTKTCFAYAKKCIEKHFSAKDLHPMIVQKINSIRKRKF